MFLRCLLMGMLFALLGWPEARAGWCWRCWWSHHHHWSGYHWSQRYAASEDGITNGTRDGTRPSTNGEVIDAPVLDQPRSRANRAPAAESGAELDSDQLLASDDQERFAKLTADIDKIAITADVRDIKLHLDELNQQIQGNHRDVLDQLSKLNDLLQALDARLPRPQ